MKFSQQHLEELNLLVQFDISSSATGIKVHSEASESIQAAAKRLHDKGLCTLPDGGYLTNEGIEVAENAERILRILNA